MELDSDLKYLTTDCVNAATAEELAATQLLALEVVEPRDLERLKLEHAKLVVDWDSLPKDYQKKLLQCDSVTILAVHGYSLEEFAPSLFTNGGIMCFTRLDDALFQALVQHKSAA